LLLISFGGPAAAQTPPDPLAPPPGLSAETQAAYERGRLIFNGHWRPTGTDGPDDLEGLGPLYNRISCASCHDGGKRGAPPEGPEEPFLTALVRIGIPDAAGRTARPHPTLGGQIQDRAVPGLAPEAEIALSWEEVPGRYPDGSAYTLRRPALEIRPEPDPALRWSVRIAPPIRGVGLLDRAVTARGLPGRFGWKGSEPTLTHQNASALARDMGVTSLLHPEPVCPPATGEAACGGGPNEAGSIRLMELTLFTKLLPPPPLRPEVGDPMGAMLFHKIGCAGCHRPNLPLRGTLETVPAYSDLDVHDMGPGLNDGLPEGSTPAGMWRTPPLWGLGAELAERPDLPMLHDGRARGPEEAILWHGGDAAPARDAFKALSAEDRRHLLRFIAGL
jgi:CxxC motif-containing protein (DUF1111 family)